MGFFNSCEDLLSLIPADRGAGIGIAVRSIQIILFRETQFIADIGSHAKTAELNRFFVCREAEKNTVCVSDGCGLIAAQGVDDLLCVFGLHEFIHVIDAAHVDPARCIAVEYRNNIEGISAGKHQLCRLLIFREGYQ